MGEQQLVDAEQISPDAITHVCIWLEGEIDYQEVDENNPAFAEKLVQLQHFLAHLHDEEINQDE